MRHAAAWLIVAIGTVGCFRAHESTPALAPVQLPDLSGAAIQVQQSIRDRYSKMEQRTQSGSSAAERADAYGELGMVLLGAQYFDAAEAALADTRALSPADVRWTYYLAHVDRFRHDVGGAATLFRDALKLQPNNVAALVWLGEMELSQGHADPARQAFERAAALDPQSAAARYGLGRVALGQRDFTRAVEHLEAAARLAPDARRIEYPLGQAYQGLGDAGQAQAHFARRGEGEPLPPDPLMAQVAALIDTASSHERRGAAALEQRQWSTAIGELRQAVALAPDHADARVNLGTALYMNGDVDAAIEQFQTAVRQDPSLARAHYTLGVVLGARGRDREAIDELNTAVSADAPSTQWRLELANALRRAGRAADSLPHYRAVLDATPDESSARFGYAMALVRLRRYREAREWLDAAAARYPDQPGFAHALARVLAAAPDASARDGARALMIAQMLFSANRSPAIAETLAMALAETGRYEDAARLQEQIAAAATSAGQQAIAQRLARNLQRYRRGEACRTPWSDDDPVFHPRPTDAPVASGGR
jgi:tetratricopeptide (TPR) repeat protein